MKNAIKIFLKKIVLLLSSLKYFRYIFFEITNTVANYTSKSYCRGLEIIFFVPNALTYFRMKTIEIKEPETLDWIDSFDKGAIFFDIGANIGVFSLYAAKARECEIFSFEPSVFNLEFLTKNININNLTEQITIVPLSLHNKTRRNYLDVSNPVWGGAFVGTSENKLKSRGFGFYTYSISLDDFIEVYGVPTPDYIKIDVDGVESLILQGGIKILSKVKSILIEVDDSNKTEKDKIESILKQLGFNLKIKAHSDMVEKSEHFNVYNQIWSRN